MAVEFKQGITQLEVLYKEFKKEEVAKQQRREKLRLRRKKKKERRNESEEKENDCEEKENKSDDDEEEEEDDREEKHTVYQETDENAREKYEEKEENMCEVGSLKNHQFLKMKFIFLFFCTVYPDSKYI